MTWDDVWTELERAFADLAIAVKAHTKNVGSSHGRTLAAHFSFRAHISFGRENDASREDAVISVDGWNHGERVKCTSDVTRADGYGLSRGPEMDFARSELESSPEFEKWAADVCAYVRAQADVVQDELL